MKKNIEAVSRLSPGNLTRNVGCLRKRCAVGKQETVVEVAEFQTFDSSITLMRMGMIKKKERPQSSGVLSGD